MNTSFWTGLTGLLAGICLALAGMILLTAMLLGGTPVIQPDSMKQVLDSSGLETVDVSQQSLESYAAITRTPLFFPDRTLPEVIDPNAVEGEAEEEAVAEMPVETLDARVAGIIIAPGKRIAMVKDGKADKTVILQEGMALEGDQAAWKLEEIDDRMISFSAGDGMQAELELEVNTSGLKAPQAMPSARQAAANRANRTRQVNNQPANNAANQSANNAAGTSSAAEVRRRIAERRAKLRAARERAEQERNQE